MGRYNVFQSAKYRIVENVEVRNLYSFVAQRMNINVILTLKKNFIVAAGKLWLLIEDF